MSRLAVAITALVAAAAATACSLLFAVSDDAATGTSNLDASSADGASLNDTGFELHVACPEASAGPPLVPAERLCIGATEISAAEYERFLAADKSALALPPACARKTDFSPAVPPPPSPDFAVLVDWCSAFAYCQWAGQRLCGASDGGALELVPPSTVVTFEDRTQNEWLWACEGGEKGFTFPYGNDERPDACAPPDLTSGGGAAEPYAGMSAVGSHTDCVGGYPGLYELVGKPAQWVNAYYSFPRYDDAGQRYFVPLFFAAGARECRERSGGFEGDDRSRAFAIRCCASPLATP